MVYLMRFASMMWVMIRRVPEWEMEYFLKELEKLQDDILPVGTIKTNQEKIKEVIQTWRVGKT